MSIRDQVLPIEAVPYVKDHRTFAKSGDFTWQCIDCGADVVVRVNEGTVGLIAGDATLLTCDEAKAARQVAGMARHLDAFTASYNVMTDEALIAHTWCRWEHTDDSLGALVRSAEGHLLAGCLHDTPTD